MSLWTGFIVVTQRLKTTPYNVLHAIEHLIAQGDISERQRIRAIFQFVTGCSADSADWEYDACARKSVHQMVDSARETRRITENTATTAKDAYCLLLPSERIEQIGRREAISINESSELFKAAERQGIGTVNIALMREWKQIPRDTIQDIFDRGCGQSMDQAKHEYLAGELMREFGVDRRHATSEIKESKGNLQNAHRACIEILKPAKNRLKGPTIVPIRDTRSAPNVTKSTHIVAVLGLLEKYGREDKTEVIDVADTDPRYTNNPDVFKPVQTKWASGLIHGDPFEAGKVVLDDNLLPKVKERANIIPNGQDLLMFFSHGDYETKGVLCLGYDPSSMLRDSTPLKPSDLAPILSAHPSVAITLFTSSCYSAPHGLVWTHSQRHAAGLFPEPTITALLKEPSSLPEDADEDTSRNYQEMTSALTAEMHRLYLPANLSESIGSSPIFTDPHNQGRFWRCTGYSLDDTYKTNYNRLKIIPAFDPHPALSREKAVGFFDDNDPDIVAWNKRYLGILSRPRGECPEDKFVTNNIHLFRAGRLSQEEKVILRRVLIARLQIHETANQYARALGLYRLEGIECWGIRDTSRQYDYELFRKVSRIIDESRLFHVHTARKIPDVMHSILPHCRKPAMYLAASMLLAWYSKSDAEAAVQQLLKIRRGAPSWTL
ncbi:hypothetical protein BDW62DRAFT_208890 [Aspergillus aurantiobrunneus]